MCTPHCVVFFYIKECILDNWDALFSEFIHRYLPKTYLNKIMLTLVQLRGYIYAGNTVKFPADTHRWWLFETPWAYIVLDLEDSELTGISLLIRCHYLFLDKLIVLKGMIEFTRSILPEPLNFNIEECMTLHALWRIAEQIQTFWPWIEHPNFI